MDNSRIIHIVTEVTIIGGISFYFYRQVDSLKKDVARLEKEVSMLKQLILQSNILESRRPHQMPYDPALSRAIKKKVHFADQVTERVEEKLPKDEEIDDVKLFEKELSKLKQQTEKKPEPQPTGRTVVLEVPDLFSMFMPIEKTNNLSDRVEILEEEEQTDNSSNIQSSPINEANKTEDSTDNGIQFIKREDLRKRRTRKTKKNEYTES